MRFELSSIKRTITEENDVNERFKGFINEVPVLFLEKVAKMHLIVVDGVSVDILIRFTILERFQAKIDFEGQFIDFQIHRKLIKISLKRETDNLENKNEPEDDNYFTTESSLKQVSLQAEFDSGDSIVVALTRDAPECVFSVEDAKRDELKKKAIDKKLNQVDGHFRHNIWHILAQLDILAWYLDELKTTDVLTCLSVKLKDERPIYHRLRKMSQKHNQIVEEEIDKMLKADNIVQSSSAWSFPVVIGSVQLRSLGFANTTKQ